MSSEDDSAAKKVSIILDVKTTGLDPARDEIIELGMLEFSYGGDGRIYRLLETFGAVREPGNPIPAVRFPLR